MKIIRAICAGEREAKKLAQYRDCRCKNSEDMIAKSLQGHYREEILFSLRQALQSYDHYQNQLQACNKEIEEITKKFGDKSDGDKIIPKKENKKNGLGFNAQEQFFRMLGVNLATIPGINSTTILTIISEIGTCVDKWRSPKAFSSWLGLCPGTKISGGKRLGGKTKISKNRVAEALRMAASTLSKSQTALGAFLRRMKSRLGPAKAITATANKMAKMLYMMIKGRVKFQEPGPDYYEHTNKERTMKRLRKFADRMGFDLSPKKPFENLFSNQQKVRNLC
jgi:transposase